MATLELGHPVLLVILTEGDDLSLHGAKIYLPTESGAMPGPDQRGGHRTVPSRQQLLSLLRSDPGLETREPASGEKLCRVLPHSERQTGQPCRTQRGRLDQVRTLDRYAEEVCLELHEPVFGRGAA